MYNQVEELRNNQQSYCLPVKQSNEDLSCNHYTKGCSRFFFKCCNIYDPCV